MLMAEFHLCSQKKRHTRSNIIALFISPR